MFGPSGAGQTLLADRPRNSDALPERLVARGAVADIRSMPNRVKTFPFDHGLYRKRNLVWRFFNKPEHFRANATPVTSETEIASPPFNSRQSGSGCGLMRR